MAIYKTRQGFGVDYRDEFGRRVRTYIGSEEAARAFEARATSHVAAIRRAARFSTQLPDLSIIQAVELYLSARAVEQSTRRMDRMRLHFIQKFLAGVKARDVTPALLSAYQQRRREEVAPSTLKGELHSIKRVFTYLAANWYIHADPSTQLKPGLIPTPQSRGIFLTHEQQQRLLLLATPKGRLRILLGLDAGLRAGEILALRANHIEEATHSATVWSGKSRAWRKIPLTERIWLTLEKRFPDPRHPDTPVIARNAMSIHPSTCWVRRMRELAGFYFRLHDLRHTFASRLAAAGAPLHVIRALLGHSPRTTTDIYVHTSEDEKRKWIDTMEDADLDEHDEMQ